jgi:hypothetical protein
MSGRPTLAFALTLGGAYTHDRIDVFYTDSQDTKQTIDAIFGVHQILDAKTVIQANLVLGTLSGYLNDPYKVVELNGELVPEKRPEDKDRQIAFVSLTRSIQSLRAAVEGSYRYYDDSFDITGQTVAFAWFQHLGKGWLVRPRVRWHDQSAASFYSVRFSGAPSYYSADYRVSALQSISYGLKLVWNPTPRLAFDVAYDIYEQEGKDNETFDEVYPTADVFTFGGRVWF